MQVQILGAVALAREDRRMGVAARQVRTLLALLALSPGTPVPFDQLVEELWAGKQMGNARNALQANVVRLRKLLEQFADVPGDCLVRTVSSGYVLDLPGGAVDAHLFRDLADRGSALVPHRPGEAIDLLERALRLWHGPALFDVSDGLRFRIEAARLDERRLSAREDLIAAKLANGEDRGVVSELKQLAAEYPERERFSEQLMVALYRNGRQTEALDVFHHTRRRLASELGLEPGRAMRRLYQAILVHDQVLL
ncbi:DNA-binding SARP family transcriptional activator [Saccharothrix saharensis]|uniref:DNA-binding SARP family transcriptional activator n=2 Tax=Saccharothrix saharensis TaxID=571190 RepID=A0A543JPT7_9PSEU|nr:DNA-binding SARP family transcriptional activator [Saccharothrix saharensis]